MKKRWLIITSTLLGVILIGCFFSNVLKHKNVSKHWDLLFFNEKTHFVPLKIYGFSSRNIPEIEVQIEDKKVITKLDLGWDSGIVLPKGMLETLENKSFLKKKSFFGVRGKTYESDIYELPEIKMGKMIFSPMWAEEENQEFVRDGIVKSGQKEIAEEHLGRVGWNLFNHVNLLLDCDHSMIIMSDSLATIREQGYLEGSFIEAPLLLDRGSIDFEVITEAGPLRCTLDTGSTWNFLNKDFENLQQDHRLIDLEHLNGKPSEFNPQNEDLFICNLEDDWKTKTFQIQGKEFGPVSFTKVKSPLDLDAIIGMEFIEDHIIFIDFRNKKISFSKLPEDTSLVQRAYNFIKKITKN